MALKTHLRKTGEAVVSFEGTTSKLDNFTQDFGNVYIKVESVSASKSKGAAMVSFTSDSGRFDKGYEIEVSVADGADNFIKQAYASLKKHPDFIAAEDC
jgi:hypothetical protein